MFNVKTKELNIYWANLCILNRMEKERMKVFIKDYQADNKPSPNVIYLGNTDEVHIYEQMDKDLESGDIKFDIMISNRFDLFCFRKYLDKYKDKLYPISGIFPVRDQIKECGVMDPFGFFYPLIVLPHLIVCNLKLIDAKDVPGSLEELLEPKWAGKVFIGSTELASARSVLFAIWYKFGSKGLETCVRNWRQKSAPSAVRHGLVKKECPIGILPSIFTGPGPGDILTAVFPKEGVPVLPSYCAVKKTDYSDEAVNFLSKSAASIDFIAFYKDNGFAYPATPEVDLPDMFTAETKIFFPDWDWALKQDIEYFYDACSRVPFE
jgi:ABC-type Fe3+ transport system substrate-binding protein